MIIIGYQGIGKSTLANKSIKYIDLESSNYFIDGVREDGWYRSYCNIAVSLSNQGKMVFVSSHKEVREYLKKLSNEGKGSYTVVVYPVAELREAWIDKLGKRYKETCLDKDKKALLNAIDRYEENIEELRTCGFDSLEISDMDYDLEKSLEAILETIGLEQDKLKKNTKKSPRVLKNDFKEYNKETLGDLITKNYIVEGPFRESLEEMRSIYKDLLDNIDTLLEDSREKSLAVTKVQEALMWTTRAISIEYGKSDEVIR